MSYKLMLLVILVMLASIALVALTEKYKRPPILSKVQDCTDSFERPVPIEWTGKIIAQMVNGTQFGIEKAPTDEENPYFYAGQDPDKALNENKYVGLTGMVTVKGNWIGITDAYRNTIFGGCVPDVDIISITELNN